MSSVDFLVQSAQKEVLDSYRREFDQLASSFRDLDGKAQGTATVAGAFLAAGLALLNRTAGLDESWEKAFLLLGVGGLIGAVVASVQALRVQKVRSCPSGDDVAHLLNVLSKISDEGELVGRLMYFYGDESKLWGTCIQDRRAANERKGALVFKAQLFLLVTVLSLAALIVGLILAV